MVRCQKCQWTGEYEDMVIVRVGLADDPWGKGESFIAEGHCPDCENDEFDEGFVCRECDEFVMDGQICDCNG